MLNAKHKAALNYVAKHAQEHGVCPSYDEIAQGIGVGSKSGISRMMKALVERGYIRMIPHRKRALEVIRLPADVEGRFIPDDDLLGMLKDMVRTARVLGEYDEVMDIRVDRNVWECVSREVEDYA